MEFTMKQIEKIITESQQEPLISIDNRNQEDIEYSPIQDTQY